MDVSLLGASDFEACAAPAPPPSPYRPLFPLTMHRRGCVYVCVGVGVRAPGGSVPDRARTCVNAGLERRERHRGRSVSSCSHFPSRSGALLGLPLAPPPPLAPRVGVTGPDVHVPLGRGGWHGAGSVWGGRCRASRRRRHRGRSSKERARRDALLPSAPRRTGPGLVLLGRLARAHTTGGRGCWIVSGPVRCATALPLSLGRRRRRRRAWPLRPLAPRRLPAHAPSPQYCPPAAVVKASGGHLHAPAVLVHSHARTGGRPGESRPNDRLPLAPPLPLSPSLHAPPWARSLPPSPSLTPTETPAPHTPLTSLEEKAPWSATTIR